MSAAASIPPSPSSSVSNPRSHAAHPQTLRDQAFTLHCQGLRSPAIAQALGVPERTVRSWIAADLKILAEEQRAARRQQLALAVECQRALTAAAWGEFETETNARHTLLDALLLALTSTASPDDSAPTTGNANMPRLPASTPAPRYLTLIHQADKEINRLLGLYQLAKLELLTPEPDADPSCAPATPASSESPAESATASHPPLLASVGALPAAPAAGEDQFPAESATTPTGLAAGLQPANPQSPLAPPSGMFTSHIPAESATASQAPVAAAVVAAPLLVGEGVGGEVPFPAEAVHPPIPPSSPFLSMSSIASVLNPASTVLKPRLPKKTKVPRRLRSSQTRIPAKTATPAPTRQPFIVPVRRPLVARGGGGQL